MTATKEYFMNTHVRIFIAAIALTCFTSSGYAAKLFAVDVTYSGGNVMVEDSSLPDLIDNMINNIGAFGVLETEDVFSVSLTYFGLPDALQIAVDRTDPQLLQLRLTSALTGLDTTLTGTSESDIKKELVDWLYLDGEDAAADFLEAVVKKSAGVITDGSPNASTAQMADNVFRNFGMFHGSSREQNMRGYESGAHIGLSLNTTSYEIDTPSGPMDGTRTRVNIPLWLHFGTRVSFVGNTTGRI